MLMLSFCFIRMSKPAAEILQKFYLRLRDHSASADGTPITARQLESLVRLAEARARLDLREEITVQDALVRTLKVKILSDDFCCYWSDMITICLVQFLIEIAALASGAGLISRGLRSINLAGICQMQVGS